MSGMQTIKEGIIKRIHVDRRVIAHNAAHGTNKPSITIQTSKGPIKARTVKISGDVFFAQSRKPLSCGARVWMETRAVVSYE